MAASIVNIPSVKVLRYSALAAGVFYGYSHNATLAHLVHDRHVAHEAAEREALIQEARVAYKADLDRKEAQAAHPIRTDPESYKYNAERWMDWAMGHYKQDSKPSTVVAKK